MTGTILELDGVSRQWDGTGGVSDVSLRLDTGEFLSILGPSGCGKSTLLRLIAGLEAPQSGRIRISGKDVTATPPSQRGLSMVFQSYALFPHLSVAENIIFGLRVRRLAKSERAARLAEALEITGLTGLERRKPSELSGGQRQRVALARAAVSDRPLCLMDEPLSNLDAKLRQSVRREIRALQRRLGLTVVYVTHDQSEAMSLSDRVVLMRDGRIEQDAAPSDLYARPASIFAAEFVGDPPMAMIEGPALGLRDGQSVGIRPEHLSLADCGMADLEAEVVDVEFVGSETRIVLTHPAARGLILCVPGVARIGPGVTVGLMVPRQNRLLFDARTGRAEQEPQQDPETRRRQTGAPRDGQSATFPNRTQPAEKRRPS